MKKLLFVLFALMFSLPCEASLSHNIHLTHTGLKPVPNSFQVAKSHFLPAYQTGGFSFDNSEDISVACPTSVFMYTKDNCTYPNTPQYSCGGRYRVCGCDRDFAYSAAQCEAMGKVGGDQSCTVRGGSDSGTVYYTTCKCPSSYPKLTTGQKCVGGTECSYAGEKYCDSTSHIQCESNYKVCDQNKSGRSGSCTAGGVTKYIDCYCDENLYPQTNESCKADFGTNAVISGEICGNNERGKSCSCEPNALPDGYSESCGSQGYSETIDDGCGGTYYKCNEVFNCRTDGNFHYWNADGAHNVPDNVCGWDGYGGYSQITIKNNPVYDEVNIRFWRDATINGSFSTKKLVMGWSDCAPSPYVFNNKVVVNGVILLQNNITPTFKGGLSGNYTCEYYKCTGTHSATLVSKGDCPSEWAQADLSVEAPNYTALCGSNTGGSISACKTYIKNTWGWRNLEDDTSDFISRLPLKSSGICDSWSGWCWQKVKGENDQGLTKYVVFNDKSISTSESSVGIGYGSLYGLEGFVTNYNIINDTTHQSDFIKNCCGLNPKPTVTFTNVTYFGMEKFSNFEGINLKFSKSATIKAEQTRGVNFNNVTIDNAKVECSGTITGSNMNEFVKVTASGGISGCQ